MTVIATEGSATASAGKTLASVVLTSGKIRLLISGLNQNVIGDGTIVLLQIQLAPESAVGSHVLSLTNAIGVGPTGEAVPVRSHSGRIVIGGRK